MSESRTNIERIEDYHEGRMDDVQRKDFEIQLLVDLQLQHDNEAYSRVRQAFRDLKEKEIRGRFDKIDQELERPAPTVIRSLSRWWRIAAISVLLIGAAWVIKLTIDPAAGPANELFPDEPGLPVLMGVETDHREFDRAMSFFQAADFSRAVSRFDKLYQANPSNDTLAYFLALSKLHQGRADEALVLFSALASSHSVYQPKWVYYMSLADYILDEDSEKLKESLRSISATQDNPLAGFATQVLQGMAGR